MLENPFHRAVSRKREGYAVAHEVVFLQRVPPERRNQISCHLLPQGQATVLFRQQDLL